jgi:hypothetical protein
MDTVALNWSCIQPQLELWKNDFLVILDCCFAAQAARSINSPRVIPENVEFLAAAGMGCQTPGPGPKSYTSAFIAAVQGAIERNGYADISEVHHQLVAADKNLMQTPVHLAHGSQGTIRLQPHSNDQVTRLMQQPETMLTMEMIIQGTLDPELLEKILRWLVTCVPHEVAGLKVTDLVNRVTAAQDLVLISSPDESITHSASRSVLKIGALPIESKAEIRNAWESFNWSLLDNLKRVFLLSGEPQEFDQPVMSPAYGGAVSLDEPKIRLFLQNLDSTIALLASAIERNVLALPALFEETHLQAALGDATSKNLGLVESLQMRLDNVRFETAVRKNSLPINHRVVDFRADSTVLKAGSLVCEAHPRFGRVLVEYSSYADGEADVRARNDARMEHLVRLMGDHSPDFHTFTCVGWTPMPTESRYGLIFNNPYGDSYRPITLNEILVSSKAKAITLPTLGQRFCIAQKIGQALLKWHNVGWVHESVSSLNIIFFRSLSTDAVDYSNPYLCGFSFSRLTSHHSTPRQGIDDVLRDVYQHPERQGSRPRERHTKEHDLYSFGVLLFEIGFWRAASDMFNALVQREQLGAIQRKILDRVERIGMEMGTSFVSATKLCIGQEFGIQEDDKAQSRLARLFEHEVLRKLDAGTKVDN